MVYSVYHCCCFFKVVHGVKNCSCSLVAILVTDFVFLTCGIQKTTKLLEMHTKLAPGSQTFRHKWRPLYTLLFLFIVSVSTIASLNGNLLFHPWVRFEVEVLSYCIFTGKFEVGFQNWFDHEWIQLEFSCWNRHRFVVVISVWTEVCKI